VEVREVENKLKELLVDMSAIQHTLDFS